MPEILSSQELARLFAAVRHAKSRRILILVYGAGLRLSKLCGLRVADIDCAGDQMCIRVVPQGAKDRNVAKPLA